MRAYAKLPQANREFSDYGIIFIGSKFEFYGVGMKKYLDSNMIKVIAIIAMTIDHITWLLFPGYPTDALPIILHLIGRLTCPIMCYFIAEGYHYTKNINKYTLRLFAFSLISHFAYIFASSSFIDGKSYNLTHTILPITEK